MENTGANTFDDDRKLTLDVISNKGRNSVKHQLLELQNYFTHEHRSLKWARSLMCLAIRRRRSDELRGVLQACTIRPFEACCPYVAVSYCCTPSRNESEVEGGYIVKDRPGENKSLVRDSVLDRVTGYCLSKGVGLFWIDEECIPPDEKATAIPVMDIVYRRSHRSIALISARIESRTEALLLEDLLRQNFVSCHFDAQRVNLAPSVNKRRLYRILQLLHHITADQWWTRCWTFQEAYVSHGQMQLLIPLSHIGLDKNSFTKLDVMTNEVAASIADFRRQTTLFCVAVCNSRYADQEGLRSRCQMILRRARSYQIMRQCQRGVQRIPELKAMSSSLYADLCHRQLKDIGDLPAILANCCGYTKYFRRDHVNHHGTSISLMLLTCFLTNGELLSHRCRGNKCMSHTIATFLSHHTFDRLLPPVQMRELTFTKRCRVPHVSLSDEGIYSRGHLWRVVATIRIDKEPSRRHFRQHVDICHFKHFQRARLCQTVERLRRHYPWLASSLDKWICEVPQNVSKADQRMNTMMQMAIALCQAIKNRRRVFVALSDGDQTHGALFVESRRGERRPDWVFTSWKRGRKFEETESTWSIENYVSLQVKDDQSHAASHRWIPHKWINGLCFFTDLRQEDVLFAWPRCFEER